MRYVVLSLGFLACASAVGQQSITFRAWATGSNAKFGAVTPIEDFHACGEIVNIEVEKLPSPKDAANAGFETVTEFNATELLTSWVIPIDTFVKSIEGNKLTVSYSSKSALEVYPSGAFAFVINQEYRLPEVVECPGHIKVLYPHTDYLACRKFVDPQSQENRQLAFEFPCT